MVCSVSEDSTKVRASIRTGRTMDCDASRRPLPETEGNCLPLVRRNRHGYQRIPPERHLSRCPHSGKRQKEIPPDTPRRSSKSREEAHGQDVYLTVPLVFPSEVQKRVATQRLHLPMFTTLTGSPPSPFLPKGTLRKHICLRTTVSPIGRGCPSLSAYR